MAKKLPQPPVARVLEEIQPALAKLPDIPTVTDVAREPERKQSHPAAPQKKQKPERGDRPTKEQRAGLPPSEKQRAELQRQGDAKAKQHK